MHINTFKLLKFQSLILILFILIGCNRNDSNEEIVSGIANTLPGTWEIIRLNNLQSDSLNFKNTSFEEGKFLENFGTITFPEFTLETDEIVPILIELIESEFQMGQFKYPFYFTNQTLITEDDKTIFQCELIPNNSIEIIGQNIEVEEIISMFKLFHTNYSIEINSPNSIDLISRYRQNEIIFNLVRA